MIKLAHLPALQNIYHGYTGQMIVFYRALFERGIEQGELRPYDTTAQAVTFLAALDRIVGYMMVDTLLKPAFVISKLHRCLIDSIRLKN